MDNLQKSEQVIARILAFLAEKGIQSTQLDAKILELDDDLEPFFGPCIKWLIAEGIVRSNELAESITGYVCAFDAVITALGFQVLGQSVKLGDQTMNLGIAVKKASGEGQSFSQIGDFFGGLLGGFTKSIGS